MLSDKSKKIKVSKVSPLSPGEVLGCTAPVLSDETKNLVFISDGRFHLEALMIANPHVLFYRYIWFYFNNYYYATSAYITIITIKTFLSISSKT